MMQAMIEKMNNVLVLVVLLSLILVDKVLFVTQKCYSLNGAQG